MAPAIVGGPEELVKRLILILYAENENMTEFAKLGIPLVKARLLCGGVSFCDFGTGHGHRKGGEPSGAIGSVGTCWNLEWGDQKLEVIGTEGSIVADYLPMTATGFLKDRWSFPDLVYSPQMHGRLAGALKEKDESFVRCVADDREPMVTGQDGIKSLEIALVAIELRETGKPIYFV